MARRRRDWLFLALLAALVVLFFRRVIFGGEVFFFRDFGLFFYPKRFLVAEAVRSFEIPFWESLSAGGQPVLGAYQGAVFYPLALIYYLFPMPQSFMFFVVAHFLVTGAGAYHMLRVWGASRLAAGAGALLWAFSPALVSIVDNVSFLASLAWLPWCLAFAERLLRGWSYRHFAGLVLSFAMSILAGAPEPVIFAAAAVVFLVAWRLAGAAVSRRPMHAPRAGHVAAGFAVAVLLAGIALAPFFYHLQYSERAKPLTMSEAASWSMAPRDFGLWFLPRFHLYAERGGIYWAGQRWLKSGYMGVCVPLLALWTLVAVRRRRVFFFAALALVFVLLAMGGSSPLWRLLFKALPGFALIRYPVKFLLPAAFAFAALAGFAIGDIASFCRLGVRRGAVLFLAWGIVALAAIFILVSVAFILWPEFVKEHVLPPRLAFSGSLAGVQAADQYDASRWSLARSGFTLAAAAAAIFVASLVRKERLVAAAAGALAAVMVADVAAFGDHLNPVTGREIYRTVPAHLKDVDRGAGAGRVLMTPKLDGFLVNVRVVRFAGINSLASYMVAQKGDEAGAPDKLLPFASWAAGRRFTSPTELNRYLTAGPATGIVEAAQYELYKETFYPNTGLLYRVPGALAGEVVRVKWGLRLQDGLYDGDAGHRERFARLFAVSSVIDWSVESPNFTYGRVAGPAPRAALIYKVISAADDEDAFAAVTSGSLDPSREAVLLAPDAARAEAFLRSSPAVEPSSPGTVTWVKDSGNLVVLDVETPRAALVYLADNFYPSFRARVDGAPAPIYRANYAFRAVPVPAGRHRLEFVYRPLEFYAGIAATILGAALLAAAALARTGPGRPRTSRPL